MKSFAIPNQQCQNTKATQLNAALYYIILPCTHMMQLQNELLADKA